MFHLLEFMGVDWDLDLAEVQQRWAEFDNWSQLILKYPVDRVEMITKAPSSGIWRMNDKGEISLVRKAIDWFLVSGEDEAFYLRVYTAGDYRYHGADMGILVSRGRFQTDDRKLTERAKTWVNALYKQFEAIPVTGSSAPNVVDPGTGVATMGLAAARAFERMTPQTGQLCAEGSTAFPHLGHAVMAG